MYFYDERTTINATLKFAPTYLKYVFVIYLTQSTMSNPTSNLKEAQLLYATASILHSDTLTDNFYKIVFVVFAFGNQR